MVAEIKKLSKGYDVFVDFLLEVATPEQILAFQLPEEEEQRGIALLEKNNAGTLTPQEAADLEEMRRLDSMISVLRAKALEALNRE